MNLTPIERVPVVMTPTMKKYLMFLSARIHRPTTAKRPSRHVLKLMSDAGWIQAGVGRRVDCHQPLYITPHGEEALNLEADKEGVERGRVTWCNIASMPEGRKVLVTDGSVVQQAVRQDDLVISGGVTSTLCWWSHWAAFPSPPIVAWDFGQQKGRME